MNDNLPPGVTDTMIPGNRPSDQEWEQFIEQFLAASEKVGLTATEMALIINEGILKAKARKDKEAALAKQKPFVVIHNGRFHYELIIKGKESIGFFGTWAADYFEQHYRSLGYEVARTGCGDSTYDEWIRVHSY